MFRVISISSLKPLIDCSAGHPCRGTDLPVSCNHLCSAGIITVPKTVEAQLYRSLLAGFLEAHLGNVHFGYESVGDPGDSVCHLGRRAGLPYGPIGRGAEASAWAGGYYGSNQHLIADFV